MATSVFTVPAGTQSAVFQVLANQNICAGPTVLGGTVLVETASNNQGPWLAWDAGTSGAGASYLAPVNRWARVTAATQAATVVLSDMLGSGVIVQSSSVIASPSSTAEQILFSFRIPSKTVATNFRCDISGNVTVTNNANVKTLNIKMNGTGGTAAFTSPSIASQANYNFLAAFSGEQGNSLKGYGVGASGGVGVSTTAYTTLSRDFINNDTEIVVTATKATGTDTFQLDSLRVVIS